MTALAVVDDSTPPSTILDEVATHTTWNDRRARAIRTGDRDDLDLLAAISRGEFATAGFRNRDIRLLLHPDTADESPDHIRKASAWVSRPLRMLRAHGLIARVSKSYRYRPTPEGQRLAAALFAVRAATLKQLLQEAA